MSYLFSNLIDKVTLSAIVGNPKYLEQTIKAIRFSKKNIPFSKVQILSSVDFDEPDIKCIKIPELDYKQYNSFVIKNYNDYINSEFVLHVQNDGFIINSHVWTDEFLNYDYIGALWPLHLASNNPEWRCGNGGFTLRSKKFLEISQKYCPDDGGGNEDYLVCQKYRHIFLEHNLKYAPNNIAAKFSIEDTGIPEANDQSHYDRTTLTSFGFHGGSDALNYLEENNNLTPPTLEEVDIRNKMNNIISDKGTVHSYIEIYSDLFKDKKKNINILEIGVKDGDSMMLWKNYFIDSDIIGLDINLSKLKYEPKGFKVYQVDATEENQVNFILDGKQFDIIIDDGSHILDHQLKSFKIFFKHLKDNGLYIIEDIQELDKDLHVFKELHNNVEILDLRLQKNRYDDVLVLFRK